MYDLYLSAIDVLRHHGDAVLVLQMPCDDVYGALDDSLHALRQHANTPPCTHYMVKAAVCLISLEDAPTAAVNCPWMSCHA